MIGIVKKEFSLLLYVALLLLAVDHYFAREQKPIEDLRPTVILIAIDGFRADYLDKHRPPNLSRLAEEGVRAKGMIPAFPSKTFPNHYSIATGLYPQNHGIVENNIYDRKTGALFTLGNREEVRKSSWWLGEPIWVTAEKQGQKAGTYFFPGTEAEIAGKRPSYWKPYDGKVPNRERVETVLSWLDLPVAERPTFLTLYFSDVDDAGHGFGPEASQTRDAVLKVDAEVGLLLEGLKARKIQDRVNLVIVSDHGMATSYPKNSIILDEIFDTALAEKVVWTSEIVGIFPREGREEEIYEKLAKGLPPQAKVYRKAEVPERFHYSKSERIAPLLVLPEEGWMLTERRRYEQIKARGELERPRGSHGYDNRLASMQALFIANGPAFRRGLVVDPFENIHVYHIFTRILGLTPASNDGNDSVARMVLADSVKKEGGEKD